MSGEKRRRARLARMLSYRKLSSTSDAPPQATLCHKQHSENCLDEELVVYPQAIRVTRCGLGVKSAPFQRLLPDNCRFYQELLVLQTPLLQTAPA